MTNTPDASIPRHIVSLKVDSYQRLRAANLHPSADGLVLVRGRNEAGKSSLIGAMLDALGAEKSDLPITAGEHGAEVVVDLGDLVVKKRWTRNSSGKAKGAITIEAADGSRVSGPAAVLKALRGKFADPVAFLALSAADQVKTVLGVLGLNEKLAALEGQAAGHYERRRDLGRDSDRLGKAAKEIAIEVEGIPAPEVEGSIEDLTNRLQAAKDNNAAGEAHAVAKATAERRGKELAARIEAIEAELEKAKVEKDAVGKVWVEADAQIQGGSMIDPAPIVAAINAHEEAAKHAGRLELAAKAQADADAAKAEHEEAKESLKASRAEISDLLESVEFPIDGMGYDSETKTLTINGIPFSQASQAQRIKAAASIAMSGNPSIRVLFAREGSLLDDESRVQLAELATASGFQLWLEVVDSNPEGSGIWIEDGEATE